MPASLRLPATTRRAGRAFTLTELIVAIVVLGLLAALAVPALRAVQARAHDEVAVVELAAIHREAAALAALEDGVISDTNVQQAADDVTAASDTVAPNARPELTVDPNDPDAGPAQGIASRAYGHVSWAVDAGTVELAMVSRAGHCALLTGTATTHAAGIVDVPAPTGGDCIADPNDALAPAADPTGDTTEEPTEDTAPADTVITDPLPTVWQPDPAEDTTSDHEHDDPSAPTVAQVGGPTGAFAMASFPSTHTSPPHHLYTSYPAAGLVVSVVDDGTSDGVLRQATTAFTRPTGIAAGPAPGTTGNHFSHLYIADASAGTVTAWDPTDGTTATVATSLDAPGNLVVGACHDSAGATAGGTCVTVATDAGLVQVPTGGGSPRTIADTTAAPAVSATAGLAVLPGSPARVAVSDHTGTVTTVAMDGTVGTLTTGGTGVAGLGWDGSTGVLLTADASAGQLVSRSPADGSTVATLTADIAAPTVVHFHGNPGTHYAADASCLYRVQSGAATTLWCGGGSMAATRVVGFEGLVTSYGTPSNPPTGFATNNSYCNMGAGTGYPSPVAAHPTILRMHTGSHYGRCRMTWTLELDRPGTVTYRARTDFNKTTDNGESFVRISVDGTPTHEWRPGDADLKSWQQISHTLPAGNHDIEWWVRKGDNSASADPELRMTALYADGASPTEPDAAQAPAPTGLAAATGSGTVNLSWDPVSGVTEYYVYRGTRRIGTTTATSFLDRGSPNQGVYDGGVTHGSTHVYTVSARTDGLEGARAPDVTHTATTQSVGTTTVAFTDGVIPDFFASAGTNSATATTSTMAPSGYTHSLQIDPYDNPGWRIAAGMVVALEHPGTISFHEYASLYGDSVFEVLVDGAVVHTVVDGDPADGAWQQQSLGLAAGTHNVTFRTISTSGYTAAGYVAGIEVTEAANPTSD